MKDIKLNYGEYHPNVDLLKGKNIIITGAGSGIGRAAALSYATHGAQVILLSKTKENLESIFDEIQSLKDTKPQIIEPLICQFDFLHASEEQYEELVLALEKEFECIDGILHNASMLGDLCEFENYAKGIWDQVMQVNVTSVFMLTKACLPMLKLSPSASIIFFIIIGRQSGQSLLGSLLGF